MKIVLVVVAGIVAVAVGVVVVGFLLPKGHVASRSASFRATPEQLFALIVGPQAWRPDVLHYAAISNTPDRELVRETTRNGETITYELLDRVPPTSITRRIATENLPYSGSWTFSLQPNSGTTVVRITERGEVYNPLFRFMSRFVFGHARTMDVYLEALGQATGQKVEIRD
jgi:hypothetical protein